MTSDLSPILTAPEAARYLRIGRDKFYRLVKGGQIRCKRVGNSLRFKREWLDEFMESPEHPAGITPETRLELERLRLN